MQQVAKFYIGNVPIYGDLLLAPMAGFSDVPHRALCRQFGSSLNYTEFVAVEDILTKSKRAQTLLDFRPTDRPMVFQIFGNDADKLLQAALVIEEKGPDIIDVNLGCSTRRVSGRGAGVGMMPNLDLIARTFALLTRHLSVPVTGKIRLGWEEKQNYLEVAQVLEGNGAAMIAIHPRTKEQRYAGRASWEAIAKLKQKLSVPIIGNGDVKTPDDITRILSTTGCDAVMIGRGAIGNPWIFERRKKDFLPFSQVVQTMQAHLRLMVDYYGEYGLVLFRKYVKRYLEGISSLKSYCQRLTQTNSVKEFLKILAEAKTEFGTLNVNHLKVFRPNEVSLAQM